MGYDFDGEEKIIQLTLGTTSLDVKDLYSKWKEWFISDGSKYPIAFTVVGGDPVNESAGIYITSYYYLSNGWKVRPQEYNHTLNVTNGVLLSSDGTSPFVQTNGNYNVMILATLPIKSETVNIAGGGGASASEIWSYPNKEINLPSTFTSLISYMSSQTTTTMYNCSQLPNVQMHIAGISSQLKAGVNTNIDWTKLNKVPRAM